MTRYLLSVHTGSGGARQPMTADEMRRAYEPILSLEADMKAQDALVYSGRLEGPDAARVVRPSQGRVRQTDGPFAETKEHLGGFYILEARDMDAALEWAAKVSLLINEPIEVRAFAEEPPR